MLCQFVITENCKIYCFIIEKNETSNKNYKFYLIRFCKVKICHDDIIKRFLIKLNRN